MDIVLSNKSQKPFYEQIFDQIAAQIVNGELCADFCLPSIRLVAKELNVSVITVKKAYELLEAGDFIYTKAGKGCFVTEHAPNRLDEKKRAIAEEKLHKDLPYYRELGLDEEELIELIRNIYANQTASKRM